MVADDQASPGREARFLAPAETPHQPSQGSLLPILSALHVSDRILDPHNLCLHCHPWNIRVRSRIKLFDSLILLIQDHLATEGVVVQRCQLGDPLYSRICCLLVHWDGSRLLDQHCLPDHWLQHRDQSPAHVLHRHHVQPGHLAPPHRGHSEIFCSQSQEGAHH